MVNSRKFNPIIKSGWLRTHYAFNQQQIYQNKNQMKWNEEAVYHNQLANTIRFNVFTVRRSHECRAHISRMIPRY